MEYGLRHTYVTTITNLKRLNPCCNGIWSQTAIVLYEDISCLNPCCNGIWSQTEPEPIVEPVATPVLILVVMEYGLRRLSTISSGPLLVLILVVMEYGLRPSLATLTL